MNFHGFTAHGGDAFAQAGGGCGFGGFGGRLSALGDGLRTGEAGRGDAGGEAQLALGLDFAEFVDGAGVDAVGVGAGAIDGLLGAVVVLGHGGFEGGAAAKSPGGVDDFGGEGVFEGSVGREVGLVGGAEFGVDVGFGGGDEVGGGEESGRDGVAGGAGFTFGRCRAG